MQKKHATFQKKAFNCHMLCEYIHPTLADKVINENAQWIAEVKGEPGPNDNV